MKFYPLSTFVRIYLFLLGISSTLLFLPIEEVVAQPIPQSPSHSSEPVLSGLSTDEQQVEGDRLFQSAVELRQAKQYEDALEQFQAALVLYEAVGDRQGQVDTLNQMGNVYLSLGEHEQASEFYQRAIAVDQIQSAQLSSEEEVLNSGSLETESSPETAMPQTLDDMALSTASSIHQDSTTSAQPTGTTALVPPDLSEVGDGLFVRESITTSELSTTGGGSITLSSPDISTTGWGQPGGARSSLFSSTRPRWGRPGGSRGIRNDLSAFVLDGQTLAPYPTLFVYWPENTEPFVGQDHLLTLTFALLDENDQALYEATHLAPSTAGILGIRLEEMENLAPLTPNTQYQWQLTVVAPDSVEEPVELSGWVERVEPTDELIDISLMDQPYVYGNAGIWYDAARALFEMKQIEPKNAAINTDLQDWLAQLGLTHVTPNDFLGYWPDSTLLPQIIPEDAVDPHADLDSPSQEEGFSSRTNDVDREPYVPNYCSGETYCPSADVGLDGGTGDAGTR
ncbi:MAG: DUF928 domain-containing protein [Symploca sp. SIO2B6]|nr:DUF928 domain-containing protein [Symploca sp. SIO2B6]